MFDGQSEALNDTLKREALSLFEGFLAAFPSLQMRVHTEDPNVDVNVEIPKQPGLEFDVGLGWKTIARSRRGLWPFRWGAKPRVLQNR